MQCSQSVAVMLLMAVLCCHLAAVQTAFSLIQGEGSCLLGEEERTDLVPPGCLLHRDQLPTVKSVAAAVLSLGLALTGVSSLRQEEEVVYSLTSWNEISQQLRCTKT